MDGRRREPAQPDVGGRKTPSPWRPGRPYRHTLDLASASVRIDADGLEIFVWVDANRPVRPG
jgi:hypothetical protein